jgi:tRNA-dihydrouridine synthase C
VDALDVQGRAGGRSVRFLPPVLLAPMEGVTDQMFRRLLADLGGLGGACTEFIRISVAPVPERIVRAHLGPPGTLPVGVQLMAAEERHVAASVVAAERAGAAFIDLNFGCPAPIVVGNCAGSALLAHPQRMTTIIAAAVAATRLPVGAKLRAGIDAPDRLEELLTAVVAGRPAFITLHARLRIQSYAEPATWPWLAQARTLLARLSPGTPLIGNGGVEGAGDIARMRDATGCAGVMVGRAALADPFLFRVAAGAPDATPPEAARFALDYAEALIRSGGDRLALGRMKQLVRWYRAGGLFQGRDDERTALLRGDLAGIRTWLMARG